MLYKVPYSLLFSTITLALSGCQLLGEKQPPASLVSSEPVQQTAPLYGIENPTQDNHKAEQPLSTAATKSQQPSVEVDPSADTKQTEKAIVYDNVWAYIQSKLEFSQVQHARIETEKAWYLANPNYIKRVSQRAEPYLHYIVTQLEQHQLPLDLALLPIVESAFDPFAYSHGQASGLWQFIPVTAERFKLPMDWWVDSRRDVMQSTRAAIEYLTYLNNRFEGNWPHAIAAYNAGGGTLSKAIRKNAQAGLTTDYWSLDVPKETAAYVPKLLALSQILAESDLTNSDWATIPNTAYFEAVSLPQQIDIAFAAELAGIDTAQIYQLNPDLNRWATPPTPPYQLVLPAKQATVFKQKLAEVPSNHWMKWLRYQVKNGDTLSVIAQKHDTTVSQIQFSNQLNNSNIRAGQYLMIPVASKGKTDYALSLPQRTESTLNQNRKGYKNYYIVKSGDSFWEIAKQFNISVQQLTRWNKLSPKDTLRLGQKLVIWQEKPNTNQRKQSRKISYTIRHGDSLSVIAEKFKVKINELRQWNNIGKGEILRPGKKLIVYVNVLEQA